MDARERLRDEKLGNGDASTYLSREEMRAVVEAANPM
jgi:hypothetical protein